MGLSVSVPRCGCCLCPCCQKREDTKSEIPSQSPQSFAIEEKKEKTVWYRTHNVDPGSVRNIDRLHGVDNPNFTNNSPTGVPDPDHDSMKHRSASVNIQATGKNMLKRQESLRTKVSTHSYKPRSDNDLEVQKGVEVEVLEERGPWIFAKTLDAEGGSKTGFIPQTFLADPGSLEAEEP